MTLIAMLIVTGPSSAMNRPSWAIAKKNANLPPTGFVGAGISNPLSTGGTGRSWPGSPELTNSAVRVPMDGASSRDDVGWGPEVVKVSSKGEGMRLVQDPVTYTCRLHVSSP